jgi:hypothetical protein
MSTWIKILELFWDWYSEWFGGGTVAILSRFMRLSSFIPLGAVWSLAHYLIYHHSGSPIPSTVLLASQLIGFGMLWKNHFRVKHKYYPPAPRRSPTTRGNYYQDFGAVACSCGEGNVFGYGPVFSDEGLEGCSSAIRHKFIVYCNKCTSVASGRTLKDAIRKWNTLNTRPYVLDELVAEVTSLVNSVLQGG